MKLVLYLSASVMVVVCATWAYRVNYATQEALGRAADLRAEIASEREAIAVLNAEWEYLNRPDRLARLVEVNRQALGLEELAPAQFGEVANAPFPPEPQDALAALVADVVAQSVATPQRSGEATPAAVTMPLARPVAQTRPLGATQ